MTDETGDPTEDAATHQPTLPDLELPEYHGQKPAGMRTSVSGTGNRLTRAHGIGDRAVLVLEVKCNEAGHKEIDDALFYVEKHKVADMFELDHAEGMRLLRHLRRTYATAAAEARGQSQLESPDGEVLHADDSGVVLTPRELAERRGDIMTIIGAGEDDPVVVIYSDGSRLLWPDEYPQHAPRPSIGDYAGGVAVEGGATVTELLHHETGEPVGMAEALEYFGADVSIEPTKDTGVAVTISDDLRDEWEGQPGDHRPVDDGGYGDVPDYAGAATATETAPPPLPGETELEQRLPTTADFEFVNRAVPLLRTKLAEVDDVDHLRRLLEAERQGRGEGHKARRGALDAIHTRLAERGAEA